VICGGGVWTRTGGFVSRLGGETGAREIEVSVLMKDLPIFLQPELTLLSVYLRRCSAKAALATRQIHFL